MIYLFQLSPAPLSILVFITRQAVPKLHSVIKIVHNQFKVFQRSRNQSFNRYVYLLFSLYSDSARLSQPEHDHFRNGLYFCFFIFFRSTISKSLWMLIDGYNM